MVEEDKVTHELTSDEKLNAWGYGEWVEEADTCSFTHHGYVCLVKRVFYKHLEDPTVIELGHFCGYIHLPRDHVWAGKGYGDIDCEIHGGLTFARGEEHGRNWIIGFDCAHSWDVCPGTEAVLRQSRLRMQQGNPGIFRQWEYLFTRTYKNMEWVKNEVISLVEQAMVAQEKANGRRET